MKSNVSVIGKTTIVSSEDEKLLHKAIQYPILVYIEASLMENGEVMHYGKTLGVISKRQQDLIDSEATKLTRGNEIVIALVKNGAA